MIRLQKTINTKILCNIVTMNLPAKINWRSIMLHSIFWVGVWFFFAYLFGYNTNNRKFIIWFASLVLPVTMIITYFMVYYLIPRYLITKKYLKFALNSFYTFVFSTNVIVPLIFFSYIFMFNYNVKQMPLMSKNVVFILIMMYLIVGVVSFINLLKRTYMANTQNKELQHKILETRLQLKEQELQYLKMQIHPHFLFNTLNTIYGLSLKKSQDTSKVILMLSNLLDYILYRINQPRISLKEELEHIQEYIELEKVRFQDTLKVEFINECDVNHIQIAPMLLIPLVENAFKHGGISDNYLRIKIKIENFDGALKFNVVNSVKPNENKKVMGGVGLENLKKRLIIHYPEKHSLRYGIENQHFIAELTIENLEKTTNAKS